jgi:ABC-2 type transport system permease protein
MLVAENGVDAAPIGRRAGGPMAATILTEGLTKETSGRLVHVLVGPTNRATLLGGRLALTGTGIVAAGLLAGVAAWLGTTAQGVDLDLGTMVGSGLNVVPTALVALGSGR